METLFSTAEESNNIHSRVIPPQGVATFQKGFKDVKSVSSDPVWFNTKIVSGTITDLEFSAKEELNDEEMLMLASRGGSFSFLDDEEEDIYTESDGTPIR